MAEIRFYKFYDALISDSIPEDTEIQGRIYNILYGYVQDQTDIVVWGADDRPILTSKYVIENSIPGISAGRYLYGIGKYGTDDEKVCVLGGTGLNNAYLAGSSIQTIFGVEKDSQLDYIMFSYFPGLLINSNKIKGKRRFNTETFNFPYYDFGISGIIRENEKHISCLVNFKLKGYEYKGIDFIYGAYSDYPTSITLFYKNGGYVSYSDANFLNEFGGELIEFLNETTIPEPLYNWFMNCSEEYIDPNMTIKCYKYSSQYNRVDKSDYLEFVTDIVGVPRKEFKLTHPSFTIELDSPPKFNYVYIEKLNRYFFVEDFIYLTYNLYEIKLKVDVLMTYKDGLLKLNAFIDRNQHTYNENLIDKRYIFEQGVDVEKIELENNIEWVYDESGFLDNVFCFVINGYKIRAVYMEEVNNDW